MTWNPQSSINSNCQLVQHSLQVDGNQLCFLVFSVTCKGTDECAYTIEINKQGFNADIRYDIFSANQNGFIQPPPGPIIKQDYTNGVIKKPSGGVRYYFFPIDEKMKEGVVLLNKTQMSG